MGKKSIRWAIFVALAVGALIYALRPAPVRGAAAPTPSAVRAVAEAPSLSVVPGEIDFGAVPSGGAKTVELALRNVGPRALRVYRVGGTCECVSGKAPEGEILPGKTARATVTFTGLPGRGKYTGSALLVTDEPGASRYEVPVRGIVEEEIAVEPAVLQFGSVAKNEVVVKEARLFHREGRSFGIRDVTGASEGCEASVLPEGSSKGSYRLLAKVRGSRSGPFLHVLSIHTDDPHSPEVRLTLSGEVESGFECVPAVAVLKKGEEGKGPFSAEVRIESRARTPFRIRSVRESQNRPLRFSADAAESGGCLLRIELSEAPAAEAVVGEFLVSIGADEEPLRLPYRFAPRSGAGTRD